MYPFSHKPRSARSTFWLLPPSSAASCAVEQSRNRERFLRCSTLRSVMLISRGVSGRVNNLPRERFASMSLIVPFVIRFRYAHGQPVTAGPPSVKGGLRPSPPAIGTLDRRRLWRRFLTMRIDGLFWFFALPFRPELLGSFRFNIAKLTGALQETGLPRSERCECCFYRNSRRTALQKLAT